MRYSEYVENKKRGCEGFPLQYYYLSPEVTQYVMEPHWHGELEIIRVLKGRFDLHVDDEHHTLTAGQAIFVNCGQLHRGTPTDCVYECIVFDMNMLRRRSGDIPERLISPLVRREMLISIPSLDSDALLIEKISLLFSVASTGLPYHELRTYSALFDLLAHLFSQGYVIPSVKVKRSCQAEHISTLLDWIDENYQSKITLDTLSEASGISKKYICRIFKKYTDRTPITYVNEIRIERACYDIDYGGSSITDAAYNNGFYDLSYFSRIFKAHKGVSPSEYKKSRNSRGTIIRQTNKS